MKLIRHIKCLLPMLSALILSLMTTACSLVMEPGYDSDVKDEFIELKFRMVTGNVLSRAFTETASEWPSFEDCVNPDDFAFFIFLKKSDTDIPLLMAVTGPDNDNMSFMGSLGQYTLTAKIPKADFEEIFGNKLSSTNSNKVDFRMMVLANTGADYSGLTATDGDTPLQYADFVTKAKELGFDMKRVPAQGSHDRSGTVYYTDSEDPTISSLYKGTIPMYGVLNFSVRQDDLYYSSEEAHLWIGTVNLLRSVAKIRVVQNFTHGDAETGLLPHIQSVSVVTSTYKGNVLPLSSDNFSNDTQQVSAPNEKTATENCVFKLGSFADITNLWIGYFPEQMFTTGTPRIDITVEFEKDDNEDQSTVTDQEKTFNVWMRDYPQTFGEALLRNHIYTLVVDIKAGVVPTVTVKPYIDVILDPIFGLTPPQETTPPSESAE